MKQAFQEIRQIPGIIFSHTINQSHNRTYDKTRISVELEAKIACLSNFYNTSQ